MVIFLGLATFILYCTLCIANRFSLCIQSTWFDLCLAVLFSSFTAFFIRESFSLAFHMHTALWKKPSSISHCDWLSFFSVCYRCWEVFWSGELFQGCAQHCSKGAEQLWLHTPDTGEILATSVVSSWGDCSSLSFCRWICPMLYSAKCGFRRTEISLNSVNSPWDSCFSKTRKLFSVTYSLS